MKRAVAAVGIALASGLLAAAPAGAHAFLVKADPAPGSVVRTPPRAIRLFFTEPVRPASGIKVVLGGGGSVVAGTPFVPPGNPKEIDIPLKRSLASGPYAVSWSEVDVEDGHVISGAFVFSIGAGLAPPVSISSATSGNGPPASAVITRWLLIAGLLVAAGVVGFVLLVARRWARADAIAVAAGLAVAALGGLLYVVLQAGESGTRSGRWTLIGAGVAAAGAVLALASVRAPRLRLPVAAVAIVLLALPTATGHASAAGVSHAVSIPADLAHLAAAAFWIGGVLELTIVARADPQRLRDLVFRFSPFALGAVIVLGATGVIRAIYELRSVHQVWTTGYGQALLVKTGVLAAILAIAWLNRRLRRGTDIAAELALFAIVLGAVAFLTNTRPGVAYPRIAAAHAPKSQTVVYAGEDNDLAIGLAVTPKTNKAVGMRATVLGFDGPVRGLDLRFGVDGRSATAFACGAGCYSATVPIEAQPRAVSVRIAGRGRAPATLRFAAPERWPAPSGLDIVRSAGSVIDSLHTLVVHSHLASDTHHAVTTLYRMVAPDRIEYHNDDGSASVIIGTRRWDRASAGARWVASQQLPALRQPAPFWTPNITDAHVLRTTRVDGRPVWVVSFLDPSTPAWFTAWVDRSTYRTLRLEMVAAAHFMHDRDGPFNAPVSVKPPGS